MRRAVLGTLAALTAAAPAQAQVDFARNHAHSKQRSLDQMANPAYQAALAPLLAEYAQSPGADGRVFVDPFRLRWAPARGEHQTVVWRNRYGVRLEGDLFSPKAPSAPLPVVLLLTGATGPDSGYRSIAQGLAEAGYLVMGVEAQGDGRNPATPPDPDASTPENEACAPGAWQEPQEMGIRETGPCPGQPPSLVPDGPAAGTPIAGSPADPALAQLLVDQYLNGTDYAGIEAGYEAVKARKTFAAIDALDFLLSPSNPWRARVNKTRVGIVGHSLGAHGALLAGNGDERFDAVVTWDGYGRLGSTTAPRIPTMFQHADSEEFGPFLRLPDPDELPGNRDAGRFAAAGVDTMVVTLGGATHQEWNYVPGSLVNPLCAPFCTSSADGERVALYYTQAWLDRWLQPARRDSARARLLAPRFDDSADRSSVGQGTYDLLRRTNVPYAIRGEPVAAALSQLYRSWAAFDGVACADLRAGC